MKASGEVVTEADLEAIISAPTTKADRGRKLIQLGCERTDLVELLGMTYGQAHSLWKESHGGSTRADKSPRSRAHNGSTDSQAPARRLDLRPTQTRYITQDGHVVLKWDQNGTKCANCEQEISFSLKYLGFIHAGSNSEPTKLEDIYA